MPDWDVPNLEGWLVLLEPGYVSIRSGSTYRIPVDEITRFELSLGPDPRVIYGVPLAAGLLGAVLVPAIVTQPAKCVADVGDPDCSGELPYGVIGAFGGLVVGGILVANFAKERWVSVPLDRIALGRGSVGVRVKF